MAAKTDTEVIIGGKVLTLSGNESAEYLQKVATYINNKLNEYNKMDSFKHQPVDTQNMLLLLNIADDYFKARKQADVFDEDSQTKDRELYDLKNDLMAAQIQLERIKEDYTRLTIEKEELTQENVKLRQKLDDRK